MMRILLDTHIALWALVDSPALPAVARALILEPENEILVSAATVWEIAIKFALGRGDVPIPGTRAAALFAEAGYRQLPVTWAHAAAVDALPRIHGDPFDRILVAQARCEPARLLTHDPILPGYGEAVLAV